MLQKEFKLARLLLFAGAAAIFTACSGGSHSSSLLPPDGGSQGGMVPLSTTVQGTPALVQSHSGGGTCASSNAVTLASQPAAGDLIVIYAQHNSTTDTLNAPSGFSTKDTKTGSWFKAVEFYKIATGTEGTSYSIGSSCTGSAITWVVADIRGENQTTPFAQHNSTINTSTGVSTFSTASLTPAAANELPIAVIAAGSNNLTVSSTSPSGWSLGASGVWFTQKLYSGPLTSTTAVKFSETTSGTSSWASLETLDLINPAATTTTTSTTTSSTTTAPVLAQSHSGGGTCTASNAVTLASQPAAGNLILIHVQHNSPTDTLTAPAGFSTKDTQTGSWFKYAEFYKIATGTEGTTYAVGSNCTGSVITWVAAVVKGENQSAPFDQHNSTVNASTGVSTFKTASLTPAHANDLPVAVIAPGSNGLSVASTSPSGWSNGATGTYFTQKLYTGPAASTSAVQFSETTSSTSSWASLETIDLINPSGSTSTTSATPAPVTTTAPTPSPTATPVSSTSPYTYHGCPVYTANDWFTTNLVTGGSSYVPNTVDPNSANIMNNLVSAIGNITLNINANTTSVQANGTPANVATSSTPMNAVTGITYGWHDDPWGDDTSEQVPWQSNFLSEGTCTSSGDCHHVVITGPSNDPAGTKPCVSYESYGHAPWSFSSGSFNTQAFVVHNLNQPFNSQWNEPPGINAAGLPFMGITDYGEDASLPSINHAVAMILPGSDGSSVAAGGHVVPATTSPSCVSSCTYRLPFGARLRLKSSYTCPSSSTNPQAYKICMQLKTYGMILIDHGANSGTYEIHPALTSTGSNPWNPSDLAAISATGGHGIPIGDFDVMTLGTISN